MAGDELRRLAQLDAAFPGQRREHRQRMRHDRGLRIFGQLELVFRPLAHQPEQVLAERLVDLLEHVAGRAAGLGERRAHADRLAALPGKKKCAHLGPCCCSDWRAD